MGRHTGWPLLLTILSLSSLLSPLAAEDTITPGNSVGDGNSLVSADRRFQLGFFTPGRSRFRYVGIWYNSIISVQTVVWVANRDRPLPPDSTGVLSISGDGSLSLSDAKGKVYWLTGATPGLANPVAKLLNSGNLVVTTARSGGGASLVNYAWQSFDYPTDSLLAGMKLGWDLRLGRNRNLTAWKSADDPAPGEYAFAMNVPRDPQIFLVRGTERLWGTRSPWTFQSISGIPGMAADAYQLLTDYFVSGPNGLYFWYDVQNRSMLSRVVVQPTGWVEGWVGIRGTGTWIRLWHMSNDFGVRVPAADLDTPSSWSHGRRVVAVTVVAAFLGMLVLGWICWYVRRRSGRTTGNPSFVSTFFPVGRRRSGRTTVALGTTTNTSSSKGDDLDLPLFDFSSIAAATNDFSAKNKLGEGGFGPVYVGQLGEGPAVAVKRLSRNSVQGLDEFKNEVMLIAKLQHRNLVRLLGCCIQTEERILVYEYMPNKSLDAFLFDKTKGSLLDWKTRYQIINGIARGLLYLHQDSRIKIIHRDLKASNVLLDKEMNPKISDFGMARMFGGDENEAKTRRVVGTYGYMSPEYIMDGAFSVKSDVFSFGVVVLEIVSGRRNRGMYQSDPNLNLLGYAWTLWKARNWLELVDSSMVNSFPMAEVLKCINVGLLCVQVRPEDRPTMASVVQMLGNDTASLPRPSQPGFMVTRGPFEASSSCSVNEVTVTMLDGR